MAVFPVIAFNRVFVKVGKMVRERRLALKISQGELAQEVGVAQSAISRLENDEIQDPGIGFLASVAIVLDIPMSELATIALATGRPDDSLKPRAPAVDASVEHLTAASMETDRDLLALATELREEIARMKGLLAQHDSRLGELEQRPAVRRRATG